MQEFNPIIYNPMQLYSKVVFACIVSVSVFRTDIQTETLGKHVDSLLRYPQESHLPKCSGSLATLPRSSIFSGRSIYLFKT